MLSPAFVEDCPYEPDALFIDEVLDVDAAGSRVVCRMPVHADLPLTRSQRAHPVRHPRHLNGGLMVHVTGMVGFVHAYYVLGLRHAEGWIGYGARIHSARFAHLATPGEPLLLEARATRVRRSEGSIVARYAFQFSQAGTPVYEGDQTALWMKVATPS
jgi:3-hydroxymyristoyl/3-hydroxydecanoyl-(acyl carrier protein) dehydratase